MKAIIVNEFGPPEVMQIADIETPQPKGSEVLVRVHAVGVNPVETYIRGGLYPALPPLPYTPGKDAAGIVEAVGENVTKFKAGDRVYTAFSVSGTYAEYTLVEERDLGRLPDDISFEAGAAIWTPYATAYRALFQKGGAKSGETVLIHGASGAVGIAAIQWAKNAGLTVIGTASTPDGRQLVAEQGADAVTEHLSDSVRDDPAFQNGVDLIIEMLANVNLARDFDVLKLFGRIVVVGNRGSLDFNPRLLMGKDATVSGMALYNSSYADRDEIHAAVADGFAKNYIKPVVSRRFPLENAALAHREVIEGKGFAKIVLIP